MAAVSEALILPDPVLVFNGEAEEPVLPTESKLSTAFVVALVAALWASPAPLRAQAPESAVAIDETPPADPLGAVLDAEVARLKAQLKSLGEARRAAVAELALEQEDHAAGANLSVGLSEELDATTSGSAEADALYDRIVAALQDLRPRLAEALEHWNEPPDIPSAGVSLDDAVRTTPSYSARRAEIEELVAAIDREASAVRSAEREARWAALDLRAIRSAGLNDLRVECLAKLSPAKRRRTLSLFSAEGAAQLGREIVDISLTLRVYAARRAHRLDEIPRRLISAPGIGSWTWILLQLVAVVAVVVWARRRWAEWIEAGRQALFRRTRSLRAKRRVETLLGAAEAIGPWALVLAALALADRALGELRGAPEERLLFRVAFVYGWYRLGIDAAYALILSAANRYRLSMNDDRRRKLGSSVRAVARLVAAIAVVLSASALLLGRGYLYDLTVRFAWLFGVAIAIRLLGAWRQEIVDSYLKLQPSGRLAAAVHNTRDRWYGIFVAAASFIWLFGRGVAALARDFALGFDQTRRALAFLFRRRIERHAEQRGYADAAPDNLPDTLVAAFHSGPIDDGELVVDHFPSFAELEQAVGSWQAGRGGGAFLLHGETGIGKTSWLGRVRAEGVARTAVTFNDRPDSADRLARILSSSLLDRDAATTSELAAALNDGPPRIVTVDLAQNLFLARVDGYDPFRAFVDLVSATSDRVFWACSFNELAFRHLAAARSELAVFRHQAWLPPWSEQKIRDLIRARLHASGVSATYEDLVVDRMEGVSAQATLLQTEEGYTRLLWDYADGNPRIALHFWLRSVVPQSPRQVRVRLFRAPDAAALERGGEQGLFVLAAVLRHENLSRDEIVQVVPTSEASCRIQVDRLRELGALAEADGRLRISTHWQRAAVRLLRRRNLLME